MADQFWMQINTQATIFDPTANGGCLQLQNWYAMMANYQTAKLDACRIARNALTIYTSINPTTEQYAQCNALGGAYLGGPSLGYWQCQ